MKPFNLHSVLKYRQQLEDRARQHLFASLEEKAAMEQRILQTSDELEDLYASLQQSMEFGVTADRLALFEYRITLIQDQLSALQKEMNKLVEQVRLRRRQLLAASKERKIMEKLRDNQNKAYRRHIEKKEAVMLDEIAVLFHKS